MSFCDLVTTIVCGIIWIAKQPTRKKGQPCTSKT